VKRAELEHLIRAAADIADDDEIVVIGSQSVLAQFPQAPEALLVSVEAAVFPKNKPARSDLIDGTMANDRPSTRPSATTRKESMRRRISTAAVTTFAVTDARKSRRSGGSLTPASFQPAGL
jgi:hypothetical protein